MNKTEYTFSRAFDFLMRDKKLSPAEKLVMIVICRYYPEPYYGSAATLAHDCGLTKRYARQIVAELSYSPQTRKAKGLSWRKRYIKRSWAHKKKNGQLWTCRVIKPVCFPSEGGTIVPQGGTIEPGGRNYNTERGEPEYRKNGTIEPPNRTTRTIRDKNRSGDSTQPANGQSSSPQKTTEDEQNKMKFKRPMPEPNISDDLSSPEFQKVNKEKIKALMDSEKSRKELEKAAV